MPLYKIALVPGDTVGPELIRQVSKVLLTLSRISDAVFDLVPLTLCGPAIKKFHTPLPYPELRKALDCQAVIFGNIGSSEFQGLDLENRPEYALLSLRKHFSVCCNLRPVHMYDSYQEQSPLKPQYLTKGLDILLVRDIQGGMLAGERQNSIGKNGRIASDLEYYDEAMIEASAMLAFQAASSRHKLVTSLDKANVLASSVLWRKKVIELGKWFPSITLKHQYIDNAAMNVITHPDSYDVILTSNVFGDIISDELTQLSGTPEFYGSAELARDKRGIYTPNQLHNPQENLTGKGMVCPIGILNAVSMMLEYTCGRHDLSQLLSQAIETVLQSHITTADMNVPGHTIVSTDCMGDMVCKQLGVNFP